MKRITKRMMAMLLILMLAVAMPLTACSQSQAGTEETETDQATTANAQESAAVTTVAETTTQGSADAEVSLPKRPVTVSFFGDSITTFTGVSDNPDYNSTLAGQPVYYTPDRGLTVEQTWWHRVMTALQLEHCVTNGRSSDTTSSSYVLKRAANLHTNDGKRPDMIVMYYGINDFNEHALPLTFKKNYQKIIETIQENYPEAEIFCCTLMPRAATEQDRLAAFNDKIRAAVEETGVHLVDLYPLVSEVLLKDLAGTMPFAYSLDYGLHPNAAGFEIMANGITQEIGKWLDETEFASE